MSGAIQWDLLDQTVACRETARQFTTDLSIDPSALSVYAAIFHLNNALHKYPEKLNRYLPLTRYDIKTPILPDLMRMRGFYIYISI